MAKKRLIGFLSFLLIMVILTTKIFAATTNIGATTHNYTSIEPAYFRIQGDVIYSKLYGNNMTVTGLQSRIWNYSSSAADIASPTFKVQDTYSYHSTSGHGPYDAYSVAPGTSNYYTYVNWGNFVSTWYGGSNQYTIPSYNYQPGYAMNIYIGAYADDGYNQPWPYGYNSYWYGNGYVEIYDSVANSPYSWSKWVNTVSSGSNSSAFSIYNEDMPDIDYSINAHRIDDTTVEITLEIKSEKTIQFITTPQILDYYNKNDLEDSILKITKVAENGKTMVVTIDCPKWINEVALDMPDITVIDEDYESVVTLNKDFTMQKYENGDDMVNILSVPYTSEDLLYVPQYASICGEEDLESIWAMACFDENNDLISGVFDFALPIDREKPISVELKLHGKLIDITGEVVSVPIR